MVPAFVRFAVLAGCILLVSPPAAGAQTEHLALGDAEQVRRDSLAVLSRARSEQALFEQWRFRQLPRTHARGSGKCDVYVGRYCFWFSDDADGDALPPEPPVIARRRGELLTALAEAAAALPGDRWGEALRKVRAASARDPHPRPLSRKPRGRGVTPPQAGVPQSNSPLSARNERGGVGGGAPRGRQPDARRRAPILPWIRASEVVSR
jgi:hypothetical protein